MKKPITNRGHPVTDAYAEHWYKLCGCVMLKLGKREIALSPDDIMALEGLNIILRDGIRGDGLLHIQLVDDATALRLLEESKQ